mmetsp:Transcript_17940/g.44472  ORF Transcript_17940/g.44472 Transcript_17940/m.44472 type:complete len:228 (+) Transcript_17940:1495-2178(+)
MCRARMVLTDLPSASVPHMPATSPYAGWWRKNSLSAARASRMERRCTMSCWQRLMTPMYPKRRGTTSPRRYEHASVPRSMMSSLVMTPMVRRPSGSTSLDSVRASLLPRSLLAGETARMRQLSRRMYDRIISRICASMSAGWSPTGTRVMPGRSTSVMVSTCGEQILSRICVLLTPLLLLVPRVVSASISARIASNSVKISPGRCRNSPHSMGGGPCEPCGGFSGPA